MNPRTLLTLGALAGPLYVVVGLAQALTRDGFDPTKHAWSLLSNGDLGWIQITNFVVAGVLTVLGAIGLRSVLIGIYGVSLIGAGIFRADPAQGFPAGTTTDTMSWHGTLHFAVGGIGFLCLIAACVLLGRRYLSAGRRGWAWFSWITGFVFLAGFAGIASGSHGPTTIGFVIAVVLAWTWLTSVFWTSRS